MIVLVVASAPIAGFVALGCSPGAAIMFDLMVMAPVWCVFLAWLSDHRREVRSGTRRVGYVRSTPLERPARVKPLVEGQIR